MAEAVPPCAYVRVAFWIEGTGEVDCRFPELVDEEGEVRGHHQVRLERLWGHHGARTGLEGELAEVDEEGQEEV